MTPVKTWCRFLLPLDLDWPRKQTAVVLLRGFHGQIATCPHDFSFVSWSVSSWNTATWRESRHLADSSELPAMGNIAGAPANTVRNTVISWSSHRAVNNNTLVLLSLSWFVEQQQVCETRSDLKNGHSGVHCAVCSTFLSAQRFSK